MNAVGPAKRVIEDAKVLVDPEDIEVPVVPKVATAKTDAMGKDSVVRVAREVLKVRKATEVATDAMGKVFVVHVVLVGQKVRKEIKATEVAKEKKEILDAPVKPCAVLVDLVAEKDQKETKANAVAQERRYADLVDRKVHVVRVAPEVPEALRVREVVMAAMERDFADREVPKDLKVILAVPVKPCAVLVVRAVKEVHAVLKGNEALREETVRMGAKVSAVLLVALVPEDPEALAVPKVRKEKTENVEMTESAESEDPEARVAPKVRKDVKETKVTQENAEPQESAVRTVRTLAQLSNTLFAKPPFPLRKTTRRPLS